MRSERQASHPEVTVLSAVGASAAASSAPGELGPSKVHNALVQRLPHRAKAPDGLTHALAPGSEPSARHDKAAVGDLRSLPLLPGQAARGSAVQRNGSPLRQIACISTASLRASATRALLPPARCARRTAQARSGDQRFTRPSSTVAAS